MEKKLKFILPDWDDRIHRDYDFVNDEPISDEKVYSHQIFDKPNFDGLLVSKIKLTRSTKRYKRVLDKGIHEHLNYTGPIFGDNGAYSYIGDKYPPFGVDELLEYYHQLGVDMGVSLDHLCTPKHKPDWELRQEITIQAAGKFMDRHQQKGYEFLPIGSAQGWDEDSYYHSIKEVIAANYNYIAIGGLSGATTRQILSILKYVKPLIADPDLEVHLFGVARLKHIREFMSYGVTSLDSASMIRTAFKGYRKNYFDINYRPYAAIRIPFASRMRSKEFKFLFKNGLVTQDKLASWEQELYRMLFEYERGMYGVDEVVEAFQLFESAFMHTYDEKRFEKYVELLQDKPWQSCPCVICQEHGIETVIFRGNNRNRRRAFHNCFVFYQILQKILDDPDFDVSDLQDDDDIEEDGQTSLDDYL